MSVEIAIVTGASSGLGGEFVRQLDEKEQLDEIWVIARREERLNALRDSLKTTIRPIPLDLTVKESFQRMQTILEEEKPDVRILINAAGMGKIGAWSDLSLRDNDTMIDLNCRAAVDMTQTVLPYMNRGSRVLEICSTAGFQPFPYLSVYSASKAFLCRYSRALRVELYGTGISVTAVCPYWVKDTEFIGIAQEPQRREGQSDATNSQESDGHNPENKELGQRTETEKKKTYVRHFPLASRQKSVVKHALIDSKLKLAVSTPGIVCLIHRIVAKFIPSEIMMGIWALLRRV